MVPCRSQPTDRARSKEPTNHGTTPGIGPTSTRRQHSGTSQGIDYMYIYLLIAPLVQSP